MLHTLIVSPTFWLVVARVLMCYVKLEYDFRSIFMSVQRRITKENIN